jgi:hypothetical protein
MESKERLGTSSVELGDSDYEGQAHGEMLYEYKGRLTGLTEYGASMQEILEGKAALPPGGLRVDISFEADVEGPLAGHIAGCDYLNIRADGRMELDIKATITTPEGNKIAVAAGGVAVPEDGSTASQLRENVKLTTADPEYAWLNPLEIWATGRADVADGSLWVRGYVPR